jgi:hypothetical protein
VRTLVALTAIAAVLAVGAGSADAARECDGLQVCVPVAGPWVVVPAGRGIPRREVEYQLSCPRGHVVGGLDAELSHRAIDVAFRGLLGSPVNPGISTDRAVVFLGRYVGVNARGPTFRPRIGCLPGRGGGTRIPTSAAAFAPGRPTVRRVKTVRVRPGRATVVQQCAPRERLVAGFHAFGFFTRRPPQASLVNGVAGRQSLRRDRIVVAVRGDAELQGVRAVVQVQALCTRVR